MFFMLLGIVGCGGGGSRDDEPDSPGRPSVVTAVTRALPPGTCSNGGIEVKTGIDDNLNGLLDPGEVDATQYICNGTNGVSGLVAISDEPAGDHCATGGKKILSGPDLDGNGVLESSEATATDYLCNGATGSAGSNGTNGAKSLLSITDEPVGEKCHSGGLKVVSWLDTIDNGTLDASETAFTHYVCNGPGTVVVQSITVNPPVVRPAAIAMLNVTASDGAGSPLTFQWSGGGSFGNATNANTAWTAPGSVGSYQVQVQISNGPSTINAYATVLVSAAPSGPVVTSVNPQQVRAGDPITISGGGFGATQGGSNLSIGGVTATDIQSWSENEIHAVVPAGATTGSVWVTVGGAVSTPGYVVLPWNSGNNVSVTSASASQSFPQLVPDGKGGAIIAWQDYRGGNYDIYAQRVNAAGTALWATGGVAISSAEGDQFKLQLVSDNSGGAIIVWQDTRNNLLTGSDIYAQRMNAAGTVLWTANGVAISAVKNNQTSPQLTSDGNGGAIIAWQDYRDMTDVYAQRVDDLGALKWNADGVAISTAVSAKSSPRIIHDGSGGAIIVWEDLRNGNANLYAQRVNATGNAVWTWASGGLAICAVAVAGDQSNARLISDGGGGVIIAWQDTRNATTGTDIYAQLLSATGSLRWALNGTAVAAAPYQQTAPQLVPDGSGGAIITWQDTRNNAATGSDIYAQHLNNSGSILWTQYFPPAGAPITLASGDQYEPQIISDGNGGAIITWRDGRVGADTDIYAQRVNGGSGREWTLSLDGVAIAAGAGVQLAPQLIPDGHGGAIITWQDYRNGSTSDIYAQRVNADGSL